MASMELNPYRQQVLAAIGKLVSSKCIFDEDGQAIFKEQFPDCIDTVKSMSAPISDVHLKDASLGIIPSDIDSPSHSDNESDQTSTLLPVSEFRLMVLADSNNGINPIPGPSSVMMEKLESQMAATYLQEESQDETDAEEHPFRRQKRASKRLVYSDEEDENEDDGDDASGDSQQHKKVKNDFQEYTSDIKPTPSTSAKKLRVKGRKGPLRKPHVQNKTTPRGKQVPKIEETKKKSVTTGPPPGVPYIIANEKKLNDGEELILGRIVDD